MYKTWDWTSASTGNDFSAQWQGNVEWPFFTQVTGTGVYATRYQSNAYHQCTYSESGEGTSEQYLHIKWGGYTSGVQLFTLYPFKANETPFKHMGVRLQLEHLPKGFYAYLYLLQYGVGGYLAESDPINLGTGFNEDGTLLIWQEGGTFYGNYNGGTVSETISYEYEGYNPSQHSNNGIIQVFSSYNYDEEDPTLIMTGGKFPITTQSGQITSDFYYIGNVMGTDGEITQTTKVFDSVVLTHSPIQNAMSFTGNPGVFSSEVTVTIDNSTGFWTDFVNPEGSLYLPPGLFYIKDVSTLGNIILFAGFIDYQRTVIDSVNKTVAIQLTSVLDKLTSQNIACIEGEASTSYADVGVVTAITPSPDSTLVAFSTTPITIYENELIRIKNDTMSMKFGKALADGSINTEGTYQVEIDGVFECSVGNTLERKMRYPSNLYESERGLFSIFSEVVIPSLTQDVSLFGGAASYMYVSPVMESWMSSLNVSPSHYLYGDETVLEVMNDLCKTYTLGIGCADGQALKVLAPSQMVVANAGAISGTINYSTDVFQGHSISLSDDVRQIIIRYGKAYDSSNYPLTYIKDYSSEGEEPEFLQTNSGIIHRVDTYFIRQSADAEKIASNYKLFMGGCAGNLVFLTDASKYSYTQPGQYIAITNIPDDFLTNPIYPYYLITSQVYDRESKMLQVIAQNLRYAAGDFFTVGVHSINSDVPVAY